MASTLFTFPGLSARPGATDSVAVFASVRIESFIAIICGELVSSASVRWVSASDGTPVFGVGLALGVSVGVEDGVPLGGAVGGGVGDCVAAVVGLAVGGADVGVPCWTCQRAATFGGSQP